MFEIPKLEYHVTDNCNLACEFCSHYSDFRRPKRMVTTNEASAEWEKWAQHLEPHHFSLIGGEPTLNPNLTELARLAGRIWAPSQIWLFTNGAFLERHPELHHWIDHVVVSSHYADMSAVKQELRRFKSRDVRGTRSWLHYYKKKDGKLLPYEDGNPEQSYKICAAKDCIVLRDGRLWKCPQVAFHADAGIDWEPFTSYEPLADPSKLEGWLAKDAEHCCSCCPAKLRRFRKPLVPWQKR